MPTDGDFQLIHSLTQTEMKENSFYDYFQKKLAECFIPVKTLRETEDRRITLLRHQESGGFFVAREFAGDPAVYRRLMTVSCPHLPRIYEVAEQDGKLLVLEEYIQGDSLDDLLRYSLLDARQTKDIALQLCEALWVIHRLGAVHRDVKPENILMRGSDAVLIDFDASRIQKADRRADTTVLGTTGYAAPEQYGMSQTDARTDIYALGVVINVMLTGEHPSRQLAKGHMGRVVRRCTMMSPDQRYRDIPHLMEAL